MHFTELLCYVLLAITITTSYASGENKNQEEELAVRKSDKRISKREASVLIDSYPSSSSNYRQKPKIIYRRISRQRYRKTKPKYRPHRNVKYGPSKKGSNGVKKFRGKQIMPGSKNYKKIKYGYPSPTNRPVYGPPKKTPHYVYYPPQPVGFGEPPTDYSSAYEPPKTNLVAEPPVDSYGAPLKSSTIDFYPTAEAFVEPAKLNENQDDFGQEYQSYVSFQRDQNIDNNYAYSKKHPTFVKPKSEEHQEYNEEHLNSYSDVYRYSYDNKNPYDIKNKPQYFVENDKMTSKPWSKIRSESGKVLVGGQYAEPPARYVPKFEPSAPMFTGLDGFEPPTRYGDSEVAASSNVSPYVNYKNSNMAFSPQNLNDAFSIVDI